MTAREIDPLHLDVEALAKAGGQLQGEWMLGDFERLVPMLHPRAAPGSADRVRWEVRGERRAKRGGEAEIWLHLRAQARLALECQRCLQPVEETLQLERAFLFVRGENQAAELDAEFEHDVLALTRALDLRELVEDELLLALPLVPRHADCAMPLPADAGGVPAETDERPNPFAALAGLKRRGPDQ